MDVRETKETPKSIKEYLPEQGTSVDLLWPESMTVPELLEIFRRRGLGMMVSESDRLHRLVELYYDYIFPMPERPTSPKSHPVTVPPQPVKNFTSPVPTDTRIANSSCKRATDVRLEDLVITSDPKRFTPGYDTISEGRTLSVIQPKTLINNCTKPTLSSYSPPLDSKEIQDSANKGATEPTVHKTKRVKLKRDFKALC